MEHFLIDSLSYSSCKHSDAEQPVWWRTEVATKLVGEQDNSRDSDTGQAHKFTWGKDIFLANDEKTVYSFESTTRNFLRYGRPSMVFA